MFTCVTAVRRTPQLPAASDKHLVWAADGIHAVAESVEKVADVDGLHTADAFLLHCIHHRARLQGQQTVVVGLDQGGRQ